MKNCEYVSLTNILKDICKEERGENLTNLYIQLKKKKKDYPEIKNHLIKNPKNQTQYLVELNYAKELKSILKEKTNMKEYLNPKNQTQYSTENKLEKITKEIKKREIDIIDIYAREIKQYPLITIAEEKELAIRIKNGDEKAREKLIISNLRLVLKISHDFKNFGLSLLDLIQEGNIGLMTAVEKFDPEKGEKFSTYSSFWIKQKMRRAISQKSKIIRTPVWAGIRIRKIQNAKMELIEKFQKEPTQKEIAKESNLTERTVKYFINKNLKVFSLQDKIITGEQNSFEELIDDKKVQLPREIVAKKELEQKAIKYLKRLSPREKMIIEKRYGLNGEKIHSLKDVSKFIINHPEFNKGGITRERIRQIQVHALKKLREYFKSEDLKKLD